MPSRTIPLSQIFREKRPDTAPVAFGRDGKRSFGDLVRDVASLVAAIENVGAGRWLLDTESAYAASVGLLRLARRGACACCRPLGIPRPCAPAPELAGGLIDPRAMPSRFGGSCRARPLAPAPRAVRRVWRLEPTRRSPSSRLGDGGRGGIPSASAPVRRDRALEFPCRGAPARGHAGLRDFSPPSHLRTCFVPSAAVRRLPFHANCLLLPRSVSAHSRMPDACSSRTRPSAPHDASAGLAQSRASARAVFSSGRPLRLRDRDGRGRALGEAPIEILGSTETGGDRASRAFARLGSLHGVPGVTLDSIPLGRASSVTFALVSVSACPPTPEASLPAGAIARSARPPGVPPARRSDRTVKIGESAHPLPRWRRISPAPCALRGGSAFLPQASQPRVTRCGAGEIGWL